MLSDAPSVSFEIETVDGFYLAVARCRSSAWFEKAGDSSCKIVVLTDLVNADQNREELLFQQTTQIAQNGTGRRD